MSDDAANSARADLPELTWEWTMLDDNTYRVTATGICQAEMDGLVRWWNARTIDDFDKDYTWPGTVKLVIPPVKRSPSSDMLLTELKQRLQNNDFRTP